MKATIELYEVLTEQLKTVNKRGRVNPFKWVVKIGPIIKVCPSERSACKYLESKGFRMNDNIEWELTHRSEDELYLEKHFKKV